MIVGKKNTWLLTKDRNVNRSDSERRARARRHFVSWSFSWLEPRVPINLHCPDPPRLTELVSCIHHTKRINIRLAEYLDYCDLSDSLFKKQQNPFSQLHTATCSDKLIDSKTKSNPLSNTQPHIVTNSLTQKPNPTH